MQNPTTIHTVTLTGHDLTLEQLVAVCRCRAEVAIAPCAMEAMRASRALAEKIAAEAAAGYDGERKAKPNCLTKEEYLRNYNELVSADIDDLLAEEAKDDAAGEGG